GESGSCCPLVMGGTGDGRGFPAASTPVEWAGARAPACMARDGGPLLSGGVPPAAAAGAGGDGQGGHRYALADLAGEPALPQWVRGGVVPIGKSEGLDAALRHRSSRRPR